MDLELEKKKKTSETKVRVELQKLLSKHTRQPMGNMYAKELNERYFLNELIKKYKILPKDEI